MTTAGWAGTSYDRAARATARRTARRVAREERRMRRAIARDERLSRAADIRDRVELAELEALRLWTGSPRLPRD